MGGGKAIEGSDMGFGIFLLTIGALASAVYYIMQRPMLQRCATSTLISREILTPQIPLSTPAWETLTYTHPRPLDSKTP